MSNNIVVFLQHRNSAALSVCVVFLYSLSQSLYFVFFFVLYLAVVALIFYESLLHNLINLHLVSFNYFSSSLSLSSLPVKLYSDERVSLHDFKIIRVLGTGGKHRAQWN